MRILVVDNYDSFTYNLVHYLESNPDVVVDVIRNDIRKMPEISNYSGVVFSPGPGIPGESGKLMQMINSWIGHVPILGVCLGMQALVEHYGGELVNLSEVLHGRQKTVEISEVNDRLFKGLSDRINTGRYHSWGALEGELPKELDCLAHDDNGMAMVVKGKNSKTYGIQFHPESVLTDSGTRIIMNWLDTL